MNNIWMNSWTRNKKWYCADPGEQPRHREHSHPGVGGSCQSHHHPKPGLINLRFSTGHRLGCKSPNAARLLVLTKLVISLHTPPNAARLLVLTYLAISVHTAYSFSLNLFVCVSLLIVSSFVLSSFTLCDWLTERKCEKFVLCRLDLCSI